MISKIIKRLLFQDINALLFHGVLKRGWVQYAVFHLFHVNRFLETPLCTSGVSDILLRDLSLNLQVSLKMARIR